MNKQIESKVIYSQHIPRKDRVFVTYHVTSRNLDVNLKALDLKHLFIDLEQLKALNSFLEETIKDIEKNEIK